ncbi:hypothetical protein HanRHA438_Chr05g0246151 [Helianthus annuus]|nr:hypothetical protein HanRHA438_Chr05g0246151 [Helianthus annuus]
MDGHAKTRTPTTCKKLSSISRSNLIVKAASKCYLGINRTFIRRPGKSYHHLSFETYTCSGTTRK